MLYGLRQASTVLIVGVVLLDTYYLPQEDPILAIIFGTFVQLNVRANQLLKLDHPGRAR